MTTSVSRAIRGAAVVVAALLVTALLVASSASEPGGARAAVVDRPIVTTRLHVAHASMQFSDTKAQHEHDAKKLFKRAKKRGYAWITGTEAGPGAKNIHKRLKRHARQNGYRFFKPGRPTDGWIAVRKSLIKGGFEKGYTPVIGGSKQTGSTRRYGPKGVVWVAFDTANLGRIHVTTSHYLTGARRPGRAAQYGKANHWNLNRKLGHAIGRFAKTHGKGTNLVFYGGDQNMLDSANKQPQGDTFFGMPLTSAWDELRKWQNTGHGNIDVVASYDRDGRVSARYVRALNDRKFFLHTDHFLVEAGYDVRLLGNRC